MSGSDADQLEEWQELLSSYQFSITDNYCEVAALAVLFYDHMLTLPAEVRFLWTRKFSGATLLFMLNRYITLFGKTILLVTGFSWPNQTDAVCAAPVYLVEISTISVYIIVALISALRIYAIWNKDWRLFALVLAVGLAVPAINIYHYANSVPAAFAPWPLYGCAENASLSPAVFANIYAMFPESMLTADAVSLATHSCAIGVDALVLFLTWIKTYGIRKVASQMHIKATISTLLLRDGTIYFGTMLALNVVDLIIVQSDVIFNPLPNFIDVITCILISRFLLNLREVVVDGDGNQGESLDVSARLSLQFAASVLGNIGAPLEHTMWSARHEGVEEEGEEEEQRERVLRVSSNPLMVGLGMEDDGVSSTECNPVKFSTPHDVENSPASM
ncbi:hypothetical protein SCP_1402660 [Sparassis crispa]|uniref:DUF6533 domain-containing protein n=1 Tax=Sparassis crispa TaxID=139825 RepID=A0A401H357_9APHY|nr:hypothetical protein SCP_1402660 [Sparassis crispa]GBE88858.1 hypothetical protein SCP_1402660 [Sparassis crispa]